MADEDERSEDGNDVPPVVPAWLIEQMRQVGEAVAASLRPELAEVAQSMNEAVAAAMPLVRLDVTDALVANAASDIIEEATKNLASVEIELPFELSERVGEIVQLALALLPQNWHGLDEEELRALPALAREQHLGVTWVPRVSILRDLLAATSPAGRTSIIEVRADEIIGDCSTRLDECTAPRLVGLVELARRAISCFEDGHVEGAQALATNVMDTSVTRLLGRKVNTGPLKAWAQFTDEDDHLAWIFAVVLSGISPSMNYFYRHDSGDPLYYRGGTIHAADLVVYSRINAVRVITMATSLLRWLTREEPYLDEWGF